VTGQQKRPPRLRAGGRRLWDAVTTRWELDQHEAELLEQAARTLDLVDRLTRETEQQPLLVDGKPNPLLAEVRHQRIVLGRLLAQLRIPDDRGQRPQHRSARGTYPQQLRRVQ